MSLNTILATAPLTTTNYVIKATGTALGNSLIWDNGTNVGIGNTNTSYTLDVSGTGRFTGNVNIDGERLTIGGTSNNAVINNIASVRINIDCDNNDTAESFTIGKNQVGIDNNNVLFRVQENGNVGIGTSSPNGPLDVVGPLYGGLYSLSLYDSAAVAADIGGGIYFGGNYTGTTKTGWAGILGRKENATDGQYGGYMAFQTRTNGSAPAERMRITSGGNVYIGSNTTTNGTLNTISTSSTFGLSVTDLANSGNLITFKNVSVAQVGFISQNGTNTTYSTSSDYRLKEDFKEVKGLENLSAIKVYDFKFKNSENRMDGVIAHELQEIIPYAVVGKKDAVNEDGSINPQGVDYSMIVPTLVKAIQEQNQTITELSNRLIKLESK